ncbi:expressed protein [Batrachochytrium dendrobatidis JAM81]|uniref:Expressed protein n=2 Tax=Batrachochytrium dendrobatidis TaxID=109871 RepID=F4NSD1_BATDJ|nr:uncharacterized protein BATDEDRAFT_36496 [Batrachochytrium dendrobatidis JAM81]EGF83411.1 expressed protein [Batrachochytrium dendrobatidis JAM81]OAJ36967.1 hypothetical protein BDEG_21059 [Batrachochytrium dendrobatidis JEL423]|eukprot:XP_006675883.1 expressed protein [Batrachochytrium dendrobatidis JAM81]
MTCITHTDTAVCVPSLSSTASAFPEKHPSFITKPLTPQLFIDTLTSSTLVSPSSACCMPTDRADMKSPYDCCHTATHISTDFASTNKITRSPVSSPQLSDHLQTLEPQHHASLNLDCEYSSSEIVCQNSCSQSSQHSSISMPLSPQALMANRSCNSCRVRFGSVDSYAAHSTSSPINTLPRRRCTVHGLTTDPNSEPLLSPITHTPQRSNSKGHSVSWAESLSTEHDFEEFEKRRQELKKSKKRYTRWTQKTASIIHFFTPMSTK